MCLVWIIHLYSLHSLPGERSVTSVCVFADVECAKSYSKMAESAKTLASQQVTEPEHYVLNVLSKQTNPLSLHGMRTEHGRRFLHVKSRISFV